MKSTINLISEIREEQRFPIDKLLPPAALILPLLLLLIAYAWQALNVRTLNQKLKQVTEGRDALTTEIVQLSQEIARLQGEESASDGQKKAAAVKGLLKNRVLWSDVFREVSFVVPAGVWLTSIESSEPGAPAGSGKSPVPQPSQAAEGKQVKFIGFAKSNSAVTQFIAALEKSEHFTEIALVYSQRGNEPDSQQVSFEIATNLRTVQL